MFNNFYRDKRVLVTGVSGVKGTWLALVLLEAGAEVVGLDNRVAPPESNFSASGLRNRITFKHGDVNDLSLMQQLVSDADGVFHLAAKVLVHDVQRNPLGGYLTNTLGVATVLESLRLSRRPKRAVFVTTDKVYKPKNGESWVETDPLGASGPYAISKACAELIIADYKRTYLGPAGHLIAVARAGNVLVGGDLYSSHRTRGAGRIFVDCFEALAENRAPEIFSPAYTRPYTYGLDIIAGYMTLMSKLHEEGVSGEAFNFGPLEQLGITNALLATKICELWGGDIMWQSCRLRAEPFDYQSLRIRKSGEILDWQPAFTLYEAIQATTRWYKAWAERRHDPKEGYLSDINRALIEEHRKASFNLAIAWAADARTPVLDAAVAG